MAGVGGIGLVLVIALWINAIASGRRSVDVIWVENRGRSVAYVVNKTKIPLYKFKLVGEWRGVIDDHGFGPKMQSHTVYFIDRYSRTSFDLLPDHYAKVMLPSGSYDDTAVLGGEYENGKGEKREISAIESINTGYRPEGLIEAFN